MIRPIGKNNNYYDNIMYNTICQETLASSPDLTTHLINVLRATLNKKGRVWPGDEANEISYMHSTTTILMTSRALL